VEDPNAVSRAGAAERTVLVVALAATIFVALALTGTLPISGPREAGATQYCTQYQYNPGCQPLVPPLIAFSSNRDANGNTEVYIMNSDGSAQTRIFSNTNLFDGVPSWSPDGQKLAFASARDGNNEIYTMNVDGSAPTRLTFNAANDTLPAWSPDGSKIAFESNRTGNFQIYVMNADGSGLVQLTHNSSPTFDGTPAWSPDGTKIAFGSSRAGGTTQIWVMNADGTGATKLTSEAGATLPAWSPDGAKIAYACSIGGVGQICVINNDGTGRTQLTSDTTGATTPSWSPDGSTIVFSHQVGNNTNIFSMNPDGSGRAQLTNDTATDAVPRFQAGPPAAPTGVTATAGASKATVSFTAPTQLGGASILLYTATAFPGGIQGTGTHSPVVVPGLTNGQTYTFKVTATNLAGTSPPSDESNPITPVPLDLEAIYQNADNSIYVPGAWTNQTVTITFFCTDVGGPGVDSFSPPVVLANEGADQMVDASCTDTAANTVTGVFGPVSIDKTLPLITTTITNADGSAYVPGTWTKQNVTVSFGCTDPGGSGVQSFTSPTTVSTPTTNGSVQGFCTDVAGNVASVTVSHIMIDKSAPVVTLTARNADGTIYAGPWTHQSVTVTFACTDSGGAGVASFTSPITISTEGSGQTATGFCTDNAGNVGTRTIFGINIDKTQPSLSAVLHNADLTLYTPGTWTHQAVSLSYSCTDGLSGVQSFSGPVFFGTEGSNLSTMGFCTDIAGNVASLQTSNIMIDLTPPSLSVSFENEDGTTYVPGTWTNQAVTATFSCFDTLSGFGSVTPPQTLGGASFSQSVFGMCNDVAGNVTSQTFGGIYVDLTPPTLGAVLQNADGSTYAPGTWTNQDVTATFYCTDFESGVATTATPVTITTDGAGQSAHGYCLDTAGNLTQDDFGPIDIDKTLPVLGATYKNADGTTYTPGTWTSQSVTVTFSCTDTGGSGVASYTSPITVSTDGANQTVNASCTDNAGNVGSLTSGAIDIDTTNPVVAATYKNADGTAYTPGTWTNQSVTVTFSCTDTGGSGVASFSNPVTLTTEGANQTVDGQCTDNVGNVGSLTSGAIDIDKHAPESYLVFDPASESLLVYGTDTGGSGIGSGPVDGVALPKPAQAGSTRYTLVDGAGNTLVVVIKFSGPSGNLDAQFVSFRYNGGSTVNAPPNDLTFTWKTNKDGSLKSLTQDMRTGTGPTAPHVTATYDSKTNQTTITAQPGNTTTVVTGVVLVKAVSRAGTIVFQF
jgi:Tol biopolymer transport system component